jgi:anti-sigma regulatory factor (Ser/Thr protein kinase)
MTAQSSDVESDHPGRQQSTVAQRVLTPDGAPDGEPGCRGGHAAGTPLDVFLHTERHRWSGPAGTGEQGFAALRFDATPSSVTRTRSFLRSTLTGWQLPDLVDDATTIAAELVANAVTHALRPPASAPPQQPSAWIALVRTNHAVVCAVADPSPALPAMVEPEPFAESGRGLHIVAELSESWGHSEPEAAGKTVWARLASGH